MKTILMEHFDNGVLSVELAKDGISQWLVVWASRGDDPPVRVVNRPVGADGVVAAREWVSNCEYLRGLSPKHRLRINKRGRK